MEGARRREAELEGAPMRCSWRRVDGYGGQNHTVIEVCVLTSNKLVANTACRGAFPLIIFFRQHFLCFEPVFLHPPPGCGSYTLSLVGGFFGFRACFLAGVVWWSSNGISPQGHRVAVFVGCGLVYTVSKL